MLAFIGSSRRIDSRWIEWSAIVDEALLYLCVPQQEVKNFWYACTAQPETHSELSLEIVCDTVRMTLGLEPCARCHDNAETDKERKTTVRVQRARANKRLSAHQSATNPGIDSPICVILKNIALSRHSLQRMLETLYCAP